MKGKIDENGNLYIERGASLKIQFCPFVTDKSYKVENKLLPVPCGDWCPLFGEPKLEDGTNSAILDLCNHKQLFFDEFVDERKVEDEKD